MDNAVKALDNSGVAEIEMKVKEILKDDITEYALKSLLVKVQENIWNLSYQFKNHYDEYLYDNMEKLQEDVVKWYKTYQYINSVIISVEGQRTLAYVQDFIAQRNATSNVYVMYYWNSKPDYNALSEKDKVVVLTNELYRRLNTYFVLCEQLKRIEKVLNESNKESR
ncbi:hypothetical protein [Selenomonas ruminantium]|uniref:Uncharacterized protein n=1 Tax=Selenomonas ruminantium TaxID=971 RepID=A0A1H3ZJR0_SELRU|nr:hypothetical protein [Selenomonas ruminantium]SEA23494.1 hypothetical protein SAMN05660648_02449 [Selenomonas ruminantium]